MQRRSAAEGGSKVANSHLMQFFERITVSGFVTDNNPREVLKSAQPTLWTIKYTIVKSVTSRILLLELFFISDKISIEIFEKYFIPYFRYFPWPSGLYLNNVLVSIRTFFNLLSSILQKKGWHFFPGNWLIEGSVVQCCKITNKSQCLKRNWLGFKNISIEKLALI